MATISIDAAGAVVAQLTAEEQAFLVMAKEDGAIEEALSEVFTLWLKQRIRNTFETRFARLAPDKQAALLGEFSQAKRGK